MPLAQLTIQQKGQPDRQVRLRQLPGEGRFGLAVTEAGSKTYRQPFTIDHISDPDILRKLGAAMRRQPTHFSLAVKGKSVAVRSEPIAGTDHIRLHLDDDIVVIVDPDQESDTQPAAMIAAAIVVIVIVIVVIITVSYVITVITENGGSDIEGEGGEREEGGEGEGDDGGGESE